jgi:hypothetical protein
MPGGIHDILSSIRILGMLEGTCSEHVKAVRNSAETFRSLWC